MILTTLKTYLKRPHKPATVIDGKLILSFPYAHKPVVWQMDLADTALSALEIETKDDLAILILKKQDNDKKSITIASFENPDHAVEHLISISKTLASSHGQINKDKATKPSALKSWGKKVLIVIGALFAISFILSLFSGAGTQTNSQNLSQNGIIEQSTDGSPVSADAFLQNQ